MSLLREIQAAVTDQSTNIATLLRKCKILAARLENEEFKQWIDNELNGYKTIEELPDYRIIETGSYGDFVGGFGAQGTSGTFYAYQDTRGCTLGNDPRTRRVA